MTPDDFRRHGHVLVEWLARYQEEVERYPVCATVQPGEIRARLPPHPPEQGEPFEQVLADLESVILPGLTHWQSPSWFGYFPCNASGPSILGELLSAGLGQQGMLWSTGPACTELETHVLDGYAELCGLPAAFRSDGPGGGVIQDSASSAVLVALVAARERARQAGARLEDLTVYASTQAHSSVEKAMRVAGLGVDQLRLLPVDAAYALRPDALDHALTADRSTGRVPTFCVATVGTTSSNAMDPLPAIGAICRREGVWLHVDGAMSGSAAVCPEFRHHLAGLDLAESYATNPHKWLFTSFDCDCLYVADRGPLIRALSILPEYLRNRATETGAVIDYRDWQIPLGRRFRALKLWFVLRHYGAEGLRHHVRRHVALAQELAGWIRADDWFEVVVDPPLNLVCFRLRASDEKNAELLARLNASGRLFLSHTKLDDRFVLRLCVGQTHTETRHVAAAWAQIQATAAELHP
jgi:aromatic-L-amino-acid decarboxylase